MPSTEITKEEALNQLASEQPTFYNSAKTLGYDVSKMDLEDIEQITATKSIIIKKDELAVYALNCKAVIKTLIQECANFDPKKYQTSSKKGIDSKSNIASQVKQLMKNLGETQALISNLLNDDKEYCLNALFNLIQNINLLIYRNYSFDSYRSTMAGISESVYTKMKPSLKKEQYKSVAQLQELLTEKYKKDATDNQLIQNLAKLINSFICLQYKMILYASDIGSHQSHNHYYPALEKLLRAEAKIGLVTIDQANAIRWNSDDYWILDILVMLASPPIMENPEYLKYIVPGTDSRTGKQAYDILEYKTHTLSTNDMGKKTIDIGHINPTSMLPTIVYRDATCSALINNTGLRQEVKDKIITALHLTFPSEAEVDGIAWLSNTLHTTTDAYDDGYYAMLMSSYLSHHPAIAQHFVAQAEQSYERLQKSLVAQFRTTPKSNPHLDNFTKRLQSCQDELATLNLNFSEDTDETTLKKATLAQRISQYELAISSMKGHSSNTISLSSSANKLLDVVSHIVSILKKQQATKALRLPHTESLRKELIVALTPSRNFTYENTHIQNWVDSLKLNQTHTRILDTVSTLNRTVLSTEISSENCIVTTTSPTKTLPIKKILDANLRHPNTTDNESPVNTLTPTYLKMFGADQQSASTELNQHPPISATFFEQMRLSKKFGQAVSTWYGTSNSSVCIKTQTGEGHVIPNGYFHLIDYSDRNKPDVSLDFENDLISVLDNYTPPITGQKLVQTLNELNENKATVQSTLITPIMEAIAKNNPSELWSIAEQFHNAERTNIAFARTIEQLRFNLDGFSCQDKHKTTLIDWRLQPYVNEHDQLKVVLYQEDSHTSAEVHTLTADRKNQLEQAYNAELQTFIDTYLTLIDMLKTDGLFDRISAPFNPSEVNQNKRDFALCRLLAAYSDHRHMLESAVHEHHLNNFSQQQHRFFGCKVLIPDLLAKTQNFVCNVINHYFSDLSYQDSCNIYKPSSQNTDTASTEAIKACENHVLSKNIKLRNRTIESHSILTKQDIRDILDDNRELTISLAPGLMPTDIAYSDIFLGQQKHISPYELKEILSTVALLNDTLLTYENIYDGWDYTELKVKTSQTIDNLCFHGPGKFSILGNINESNIKRLYGNVNSSLGNSSDTDPRTKDFRLMHYFISLAKLSSGDVQTAQLINTVYQHTLTK